MCTNIWARHKGGLGWRWVGADCYIELEQEGVPDWLETGSWGEVRTRGEPLSAKTLRDDFGPLIYDAADEFSVSDALIAGIILVEAGRIENSYHRDPISLRDEDGQGFRYWPTRPDRVSAGLMQTLVSTAREMAREYDLPVGFRGRTKEPGLGDLLDPERSIWYGAAYLRHLSAQESTTDDIMLCAAYNAGGIYEDADSPWNLRTYSDDRIPKFGAFHNDWLAIQ